MQHAVRGHHTSDGGGVRLYRVIGTPEVADVDPFLLLDEFRSDEASHYIAGFPDHPHRGFQTVTYMLAGRMRHRDNQGNSGLLVPGSVQWMSAGRGIVHSEMPEQEDGLMWGFQLWVNLPARDKMTAPRYQDVGPDRIPTIEVARGASVRVIAGSFDGVAGPVHDPAIEPLYLDVTLGAGLSLEVPVPAEHDGFVYPFVGTVGVGDGVGSTSLQRGTAGLLARGDRVVLAANHGDTRLILVTGRPLREPVARHGPFVMTTQDEIREAIVDYRAGRL